MQTSFAFIVSFQMYCFKQYNKIPFSSVHPFGLFHVCVSRCTVQRMYVVSRCDTVTACSTVRVKALVERLELPRI